MHPYSRIGITSDLKQEALIAGGQYFKLYLRKPRTEFALVITLVT